MGKNEEAVYPELPQVTPLRVCDLPSAVRPREKMEQQGAESLTTEELLALLLGNQAEADLKPELEIFADDVKCAHGAAVGDLDADSLFYLRARGIPEKEARHLLIHAFLEDALTDIANADLREQVRGAVSTALDQVAT